MSFNLKENEQILANFAVQLLRNIESVDGNMTITNQRVLFEAGLINVQKKPLEIPLDEISKVCKKNTFWIIPGILIQTKSDMKYGFIVIRNREKLISLIENQLIK